METLRNFKALFTFEMKYSQNIFFFSHRFSSISYIPFVKSLLSLVLLFSKPVSHAYICFAKRIF